MMRIACLLRIAFVFSCCISLITATAQDRLCGFDASHHQLLNQNAGYRKLMLRNEEQVQRSLQGSSMRTLGTVHLIPVVVHVIHHGEMEGTGSNISDDQIESAIVAMTQHYRGELGNSIDTEIEFVLARLGPDCAPTNGIVRINGNSVPGYATNGLTTGPSGNELAVKDLSRWSTGNYYNIWIVSEINNNGGGSGVQGFAYFPGAPADRDGAVILYNAFGYDPSGSMGFTLKSYTKLNTTATHEMGHALGLYHTFEGDDSNPNDAIDAADQCPPNASCSAQGDLVCDTDPHQRTASVCPAPGTNNPCTGLPLGTIVSNYMDYSSESCQDRFSAGQVSRMRAYLELIRPGLTTSLAASSSYPYGTFIAPVAPSCTPATGPDGLSGAYAGIMNVSLNGRNFTSSDASANGDNGYVDGATCLNVVQLQKGTQYTFTVTVLNTNYEQVRAWIDFNNSGDFDNSEEIFADTDIAPAGGYFRASGDFIVPATATANTFLRMRVISELGTTHGYPPIPDGCYAPDYGQVEDYVVRISAGVLPVTLLDFSGKLVGNEVALEWKTSAEQNSRNFEVQRSNDGNLFSTIGTVTAAGNSSSTQAYSFKDAKAGAINYYRLKMNDQDGRSKTSTVVLIRNAGAAQRFWIVNNPFKQQLDMRFAQKPAHLNLQLINASGSVLAERTVTNSSESINWLLPVQLASGVYIIRAIADGKLFSAKVVKE